MPRNAVPITAENVTSIGIGSTSIMLWMRAASGPKPVLGRQVHASLGEADIAFMLGSLSKMDAYRHYFNPEAFR